MKKQNLQKELYPILENESIKIGTFKANRSIDTLDFIKGNIKFWKSYDGHKLPEKQVKRAYYNGTRTQKIIKMYLDTPELIKFVREHASDYNTLICDSYNCKLMANILNKKNEYGEFDQVVVYEVYPINLNDIEFV